MIRIILLVLLLLTGCAISETNDNQLTDANVSENIIQEDINNALPAEAGNVTEVEFRFN